MPFGLLGRLEVSEDLLAAWLFADAPVLPGFVGAVPDAAGVDDLAGAFWASVGLADGCCACMALLLV